MKGDIIPNGDYLYKYVNPKSFPEDQTEIPFGIFEDRELSCDWAYYQKYPEKSFHVAEGKTAIVQILVCDEIKMPCNPKQPRQQQPDWAQTVMHDPIEIGEDQTHPTIGNESHSLIKGLKKIHITKAIAANSKIYRIVKEVNVEVEKKELEIGKEEANVTIPRNSKLIVLILFIILCLILFLIFSE